MNSWPETERRIAYLECDFNTLMYDSKELNNELESVKMRIDKNTFMQSVLADEIRRLRYFKEKNTPLS